MTDLRATIAAHVARIDAAEAAADACIRTMGRAYCDRLVAAVDAELRALGQLVYEWAKGEGNDD